MKNLKIWLPILFLAGCAGFERNCASWSAQSFGADWVVVQLAAPGQVVRCWKLTDTSIANEEHSDGIYWKDPQGHLVHISGWYNRVQVNTQFRKSEEAFAEAGKTLGIDIAACTGGAYTAPESKK